MKRSAQTTVALSGLLLFLLFTLCMIFVLLIGVNTYQQITASLSAQFKERSCINYITEKVRHYDSSNSISLTQKDTLSILTLSEVIEGQTYNTAIYHYEGRVYELFAPENFVFTVGDGTPILEIDSLDFEFLADRLLQVTCEEEGRQTSSLLAIYCETTGDQP